jgi:hypothetical protein
MYRGKKSEMNECLCRNKKMEGKLIFAQRHECRAKNNTCKAIKLSHVQLVQHDMVQACLWPDCDYW